MESSSRSVSTRAASRLSVVTVGLSLSWASSTMWMVPPRLQRSESSSRACGLAVKTHSAFWERNQWTVSSSSSRSKWVTLMSGSRPSPRARRSKVSAISPKKGFTSVGTMSPRMPVVRLRRLRAWRFGWYLSSRAAARMRSRVREEMLKASARPFSTMETVVTEKPVAAASSFSEVRLRPGSAGAGRARGEPGLPVTASRRRW